MEKEHRNSSIDILKGILILMVVWGHIVYSIANFAAVSPKGWVYVSADYIATVWIAPYYMAAFFFITGFCSSFSRSIKEQVIIDFRRLIIPSIIIPVIMSLFTICPICPIESFKNALFACLHLKLPWFLVALFLGKLFFKLMLNLKWKWVYFPILSLGGVFMMNEIEKNYLNIFQAMIFTFFIAIGYEAKKYKISKKWMPFAIVFYSLIVLSFHISGDFVVPALCGVITFKTSLWTIFILMAILGTGVWYVIAKNIVHSVFLSYLGKESLIVYLVHFTFLKFTCVILKDFIQAHNGQVIPSLIIILLLFCGATLWSLLWTFIIKAPYLRWIIGK